jgi:hypothetical protein
MDENPGQRKNAAVAGSLIIEEMANHLTVFCGFFLTEKLNLRQTPPVYHERRAFALFAGKQKAGGGIFGLAVLPANLLRFTFSGLEPQHRKLRCVACT